MNNSDRQAIININEIASMLKTEKNLIVSSHDLRILDFGLFFDAKDTIHREYTIQIFVEEEEKHIANEIIDCRKDIETAKQKAKLLKTIYASNTSHYIQCYDDYSIGKYYFIQYEKFSLTLEDWITQGKNKLLSEKQFTKLVVQILEALRSLHENNCILSYRSSLQSFIIDAVKLEIKIIHFQDKFLVSSDQVKQHFLTCLENNQLFFYPPATLEAKDKEMIQLDEKTDLWCIGICLYCMADVSYLKVIEYIYGESRLCTIRSFSLHFNAILSSILIKNQQSNLSIPCLIQQLKNFLLSNIEQNEDNNLDQLPQSDLEIQTELDSLQDCVIQLSSNFISNSKVEETLKRFIQILPKYDQLYTYLGLYQLTQSQPNQAISSFKKAVELNPFNDFSYYQIGQIYHSNSSIDSDGKQTLKEDASMYYQKAIEINPLIEAYIRLGQLFIELNQTKQLIELYEKAIQKQGIFNTEMYNYLGDAYRINSQADQAIEVFQKSLQLNPKQINVNLKLSTLFEQKNNENLTIQYCKQETEVNPKCREAFIKLGDLYRKKKDYYKAIDNYQKCVYIDANDDDAFVLLGISYLGNDQYAPATYVLQNAIKINAKNEDALLTLGQAHFKNKYNQQAIDTYLKLIEINPNHLQVYQKLALCYERTDKEKYLSYLLKYQSLQPNDITSYYDIAYLYTNYGEHKKALEQYQKLLDTAPEETCLSNIYLGLASCSINLCNYENATKCYKKALMHNPNSSITYEYLIELYESTWRLDKVIYYSKQALDYFDGYEYILESAKSNI